MSESAAEQPSLTILVIEDDVSVCGIIRDGLAEFGVKAICAIGDQEAYATLLRSWPQIDAVVADIDLGKGTTGYDVARFARGLNRMLPVVYVTGGVSQSFSAHAVPGGVLLRKPFEIRELVATLERLTADERGGAPAPGGET